ncbi:MAG: selenocysteine-specific translation elongation factor [Pseudomonadota bacterium]
MIIATAGHIDHGKTVLVKALTGVDTDRLPEEKQRGVSIDLGFAYDTMGEDTRIGFVDVPGHERFVRNMLAGVTGIDFALLVVAADDGPMPQTLEHLAILDLLGVDAGAVALTKVDRVAAERVKDVEAQIEHLLSETRLAGADIFPVSGITKEGIPELRAHLAAAAAAHAEESRPGNFRLAVDRCFTLTGAGVVVTGTVFSGSVAVGDRLTLSPSGMAVRVRAIHAQNQQSDHGASGERCAINITGTGLSKDAVHRGNWLLSPAAHAPTRLIDARIRVLPGESRPVEHWTPVHAHLGAADVTGRVAVLEGGSIAPGASGLVQLVLDRPLGAMRGDRLILRDQSAQRTVGGGAVIDPFSPRKGRRSASRLAMLAALETESADERLAAVLDQSPGGVALNRLMLAWNLDNTRAERLWRGIDMVRMGKPDDPIGISSEHWTALRSSVVDAIRAWHDARPDQPGPGEARLLRLLPQRVTPEVLSALLLDLLREKEIVREGSGISLPGHRPALLAADAELWERIVDLLDVDNMRPPRVREIAEELDIDLRKLEQLFGRVTRMGLVYRVADNRYYLSDTLRQLGQVAESLSRKAPDDVFDAKAFRDASGIGRNVAIQVLEFFDKLGLTRREGDVRRIHRPVSEIFE